MCSGYDVRMKYFLILTVFFVFCSHSAFASCSLRDEKSVSENTEKAYYIGLVKRVYYQEWPSGSFKEAGLKPFMVYQAKAGINLDDLIIITRSEIRTSCDISPSSGINEVLIMERDGRLDMVRLGQINFGGSLNELRKKARYVGDLK